MLLLECSWCLLKSPSTGNSTWQSLDIVFRHVSSFNKDAAELFKSLDTEVHALDLGDNENAPIQLSPESFGSPKAFQFFLQCLRATCVSGPGLGRVAKLIVPLQNGHIVRSDILPLRLWDSQYVETALSFAEPLESYECSAIAVSDANDLPALLSAATAGLLLKHDSLDTAWNLATHNAGAG